MAQGKATISNQNLAQNEGSGVEKRLLFIGEGKNLKNQITSVNTQSDFKSLFGDAPMLNNFLETAMLNGGQSWEARVLVLDKATVDDTLVAADIASLAGYAEKIAMADVEGMVISSLHAEGELKTLVEAMQALKTDLMNTYAQPMWSIIPASPYAEQDWSAFHTTLDNELKDVVAERIVVTPMTHDNGVNAAVLAGRLCRHDVSVADKPMKVLLGATEGLGDLLTIGDDDKPLTLADLSTFDSNRFSVPQMYTGKPGWFWADANTLADPTSDYNVLENVRVADYAGRRIRQRAINMIGDRSVNSTPASQEYTKNELLKILNRMAKATTVGGKPMPGMIEQPTADSITLHWETRNKLNIYYTLKTFDNPVEINNFISLDLTDPES